MDSWQTVQSWFLEFGLRDSCFPACPFQLRFWKHGVRSSAIHHWPPLFFDHWIEMIQKGMSLALNPALSAIAEPSDLNNSSFHPPLSFLHLLSHIPNHLCLYIFHHAFHSFLLMLDTCSLYCYHLAKILSQQIYILLKVFELREDDDR